MKWIDSNHAARPPVLGSISGSSRVNSQPKANNQCAECNLEDVKLHLVASCNGVENLVCQFALLGESEATQAISWGRTSSASHSPAWWALAAWADMTMDPNIPTTPGHFFWWLQ